MLTHNQLVLNCFRYNCNLQVMQIKISWKLTQKYLNIVFKET